MKKRILSILLASCMAFALLKLPASASTSDGTVRVGLYYGSTALAAPQLQNFQGSGYQAGYYDDSESFHSLYPISDTKVVILRDANYNRATNGTYVPASGTTATVGAYHVQLPATYSTAAQAQTAAKSAGGFAAYVDGTYRVRTGSYATLLAAQTAGAPLGDTPVGGSSTCTTVIETESGSILFEYDGTQDFAMAPQGSHAATWCKGYKYYGNFAYPRASNGNLSVINYVSTEDYVKGVIPYEMSADWNIEALKAQAVCARSYAMSEIKHKADGFDLCATTHCQVYQGLNLATANSDAAVDGTKGIYATASGKPVQLFYFSSDGGATEDAANVWGGDYSYLIGKSDPYETAEVPESKAVWSVTLTAAQVQSKIKAIDSSFGTLANLAVTKNTAVGNVLEVTATDTTGKKVTISKAACRSTFSLNSQRYTITANGSGSSGGANTTPTSIGAGILSGFQKAMNGTSLGGNPPSTAATGYTFQGTGWGHHVGMSQYGAKAMAAQGKSYADILNFYFTGITLAK